MVYTYNEILFGHKKQWNSDTFCNMDEPWKLKWNKQDTKEQMLYDPTYMKFLGEVGK